MAAFQSPNSPSLIGLRRPSTAPLPSHLPQESRAYSPDFFYMPPAAADDLMLNAAVPDFSAPAPFMEVSGFSNAFQYARRPSRDAMQTHFALEAATACQTPQPLQPTASYLPHPDLSTWSHNIPPVTSQPASEPLLTDTKSAPKILRPPNAWILYRSDKLAEAKNAQGQRTPQAELSKLIAESWRSEKPEVKRSYEKQAELRKQQHEAQYPGYKFQPKKRGRAAIVPKSRPNTRKRAATASSNSGNEGSGAHSSAVSSRATSPSTPPGTGPQFVNAPIVVPNAAAGLPLGPHSPPSAQIRPSTATELWCKPSHNSPRQSSPFSFSAPAVRPATSWGAEARPIAAFGLHQQSVPSTAQSAYFQGNISASPLYYDRPVPQSAPADRSSHALQNQAGYLQDDTFAFVPPPSNYQFPPPAPSQPSNGPSSVGASPSLAPASTLSHTTISDPASPADYRMGDCGGGGGGGGGQPAWWPFRDVKVVRDEVHGVRLQSFLEDMAEKEGEHQARYTLEAGYPMELLSSRPNTAATTPYSPRSEIGTRPDTAYSLMQEDAPYGHPQTLIQS